MQRLPIQDVEITFEQGENGERAVRIFNGRAYCAGSGDKATRKGMKYRERWSGHPYNQYNRIPVYLCSFCGSHFAKDESNTLALHGYKLTALEKAKRSGESLGICADCGDAVLGMDYLCVKCRGQL